MCGRLALFSDPISIARHFGVACAPALTPRWNAAPRQPLTVVRATAGGRELTPLEWGLLPSWAKPDAGGPRPINARLETAAAKPLFRAAWRRRRCLVPADGYYEWTQENGARQPWYIANPDGTLLGLAGLWEHWRAADGSERQSVAILTHAARAELTAIHDRMPVIIAPPHYAAWLDPGGAPPTGTVTDDLDLALFARRVSRHVNDPRHEGAELLAAPA